jgi:Fe-S cluster assembly protein SufD
MLMPVLEEKSMFLSDFEQAEAALKKVGPPALHAQRQTAIERFAALGFPTLEDEEWRFTSLAPLTRTTFQPAGPRPNSLDAQRLEQSALSAGDGYRLVFVNGHHAPELSSPRPLPPGTVVGSLAEALRTQPERVAPHLARHADYEEHAFTALNTAFLRDGALVFLPRGAVVEEPIHLIFLATAQEQAVVAHPRTLIVADTNSQARIVESYVGLAEDVYFTNAVTEVVAGEGAVLDHYRLQRESKAAFHIATLQILQGRASNFSSQNIVLGGGLVRNDINAVLDAEGCECTLNGLYLAGGRQLIDNHTRIDHAKPRCASHELYKGILDGSAHGVFNGKIYVHPDAQKTDAKQTNQTLLLSEDATINTKPQLEIFADDVKCTHGATVGQLDAEALFYLRTRGIDHDAARSLLTYAFANDIISRVKIEPLRARLEQWLLAAQRLPQEPRGQEAI